MSVRREYTNPSVTAQPRREQLTYRENDNKKPLNPSTVRPRPGLAPRGVEFGPKDETLRAIDDAVTEMNNRIRAMPKIMIRRGRHHQYKGKSVQEAWTKMRGGRRKCVR